jgi:hypothetical protein
MQTLRGARTANCQRSFGFLHPQSLPRQRLPRSVQALAGALAGAGGPRRLLQAAAAALGGVLVQVGLGPRWVPWGAGERQAAAVALGGVLVEVGLGPRWVRCEV